MKVQEQGQKNVDINILYKLLGAVRIAYRLTKLDLRYIKKQC